MKEQQVARLYTDEKVVRIVAAFVIGIATLALILHSQLLTFLLIADFGIRAFTFQQSPLVIVAKQIAKLAHLNPSPIFAAPKRFAASLGFVFSVAIYILLVLDSYPAANTVGTLLIVCALLESVFKICLGCYLFDWFVVPLMKWRNKTNGKRPIE